MTSNDKSEGATASRPLLAWLILGLAMLAFAVLHTKILGWKSVSLMAEWPIDLTFFHNLVWKPPADKNAPFRCTAGAVTDSLVGHGNAGCPAAQPVEQAFVQFRADF